MVWSRLLPPAVFTGLAINTLFSPPSSMGFNWMKGKATFRVLAISTWCGTLCFFFSLVKSLCSSWSTVFCFKFQDWKWPDKFIKKKITFPSQSAPGPSWCGYEFGRSGNYTLLNRGITASCFEQGSTSGLEQNAGSQSEITLLKNSIKNKDIWASTLFLSDCISCTELGIHEDGDITVFDSDSQNRL